MATELITLTPTPTSNGIEWVMCQVRTNNCGGPGNPENTEYPEIVFPKDKSPLVVFQIKSTSEQTSGITFKNVASDPLDASEALWVTTGKDQDDDLQGGQNSNGQFDNIVLAAPTALVFNNKNNNKEWFTYKLHFTGPPGVVVNPIDPDILNGGKTKSILGGAELLLSVAVVASLISVLVGSLVAFLVARAEVRRGFATRNDKSAKPNP